MSKMNVCASQKYEKEHAIKTTQELRHSKIGNQNKRMAYRMKSGIEFIAIHKYSSFSA